ncbi:MAG: hypothetical protein ACM3PY_14480 [Omnitrophica WOR_2 bacterium]
MKWVLNIVGLILILLGVIWLLQGINVLPGSFMSGHLIYSALGIVVGALGAVLLIFNSRRRRPATVENNSRFDR